MEIKSQASVHWWQKTSVCKQ